MTGTGHDVVLDVQDLSVGYGSGPRAVRAVDSVSLSLRRGEVLGIAGESGSGKSTLAFAMNRLLRPPGVITGGSVRYHTKAGRQLDLLTLTGEELRAFRWAELAIVFQSAMNALNPVLSIRAQITDTLRAHGPRRPRAEERQRIEELLRMVGISVDRASAYPHELSGGMRQRAMIAIALALEPEIIVMDEPTTALDVVMQRQILRVIMGLRKRLGFSVIFITHDLSLLLEIADRIAVMYAGRMVELGRSQDLYRRPRHPYSRGLLRSFPMIDGPRVELTGIPGWPPDLRSAPPGCAFHPRCAHASGPCKERLPRLLPPSDLRGAAGDGGEAAGTDPAHQVACLLYEDAGLGPVPQEMTGQ